MERIIETVNQPQILPPVKSFLFQEDWVLPNGLRSFHSQMLNIVYPIQTLNSQYQPIVNNLFSNQQQCNVTFREFENLWNHIGGGIICGTGGSHRQLIGPQKEKIFGIFAHSNKQTYGPRYIKYLQTAVLYSGCRPTTNLPIGDTNNLVEQITTDKILPIRHSPSAWSASTIASQLCKNPQAHISPKMVHKVKLVSDYLESIGYQLEGVPADGNCFFSAFLKSYYTFHLNMALLDMESNKITYLREIIASYYKAPLNKRAEKIRQDKEWVSIEEGGKLANFFKLPMRVVAVNTGQIEELNDMLIFTDLSKESQKWNTILETEKPAAYIFIVDVGGQFLWAKPQES